MRCSPLWKYRWVVRGGVICLPVAPLYPNENRDVLVRTWRSCQSLHFASVSRWISQNAASVGESLILIHKTGIRVWLTEDWRPIWLVVPSYPPSQLGNAVMSEENVSNHRWQRAAVSRRHAPWKYVAWQIWSKHLERNTPCGELRDILDGASLFDVLAPCFYVLPVLLFEFLKWSLGCDVKLQTDSKDFSLLEFNVFMFVIWDGEELHALLVVNSVILTSVQVRLIFYYYITEIKTFYIKHGVKYHASRVFTLSNSISYLFICSDWFSCV